MSSCQEPNCTELSSVALPDGFPDRLPSLTIELLWDILDDRLEDDRVNQLLWHGLGYQWDPSTQAWLAPADWQEDYPEPPNFIESRPATVKLTRSIPAENKQLLKEYLGFKGYKVGELVPRKTRRATAVNWLLGYLKAQNLLPVQPPDRPSAQDSARSANGEDA